MKEIYMEATINFMLAEGIPEDEIELLLEDAEVKFVPSTGDSYSVITINKENYEDSNRTID